MRVDIDDADIRALIDAEVKARTERLFYEYVNHRVRWQYGHQSRHSAQVSGLPRFVQDAVLSALESNLLRPAIEAAVHSWLDKNAGWLAQTTRRHVRSLRPDGQPE